MDKNYWPDFWKKHGEESVDASEHIQVLRTKNQAPIDEELWRQTVSYILRNLALRAEDDVLDLCCGNGLITKQIAQNCRSVTCIDVAKELVSLIDTNQHPSITPLIGDIRDPDLYTGSFDKILNYAGIQYLDFGDTVEWFERMHSILRSGGTLFIGDIPDRAKLWQFFDSPKRKGVHFECTKKGEAIIGTWFERDWLTNLAEYAGFANVEIIAQKDYMINSEYRFDMKISK